jgi:hypothetical protein
MAKSVDPITAAWPVDTIRTTTPAGTSKPLVTPEENLHKISQRTIFYLNYL